MKKGWKLGALETDHDGGRKQAERDKGDEESEVPEAENAFGQFRKVRHYAEHVGQLDEGPENKPAAFHIGKELTDFINRSIDLIK